MAETATREAYGKKLVELGEKYPQVVVLDADLSGSTKTEGFAKKFPERFINCGVAEQDMLGTAAGLAATGKVVFASSFAIFAAGRAWEPFRQSAAYPHLNVKICATHAGITVGEDGASHQMIEDIALMRVIPGVKVFVPADGPETEKILEAVVTDEGPAYIRLSRAKSPILFDASYQFEIGKGQVIKKGHGQGPKVCLFACGFETHLALQAAELLKDISVTVVNMASIKPLDAGLVVQMAKTHDVLFSVEEHSVIGGLGSAISEVLTDQFPKRLVRLGMQDEFGQSASHPVLLQYYKLDGQGIAESIRKNLNA